MCVIRKKKDVFSVTQVNFHLTAGITKHHDRCKKSSWIAEQSFSWIDEYFHHFFTMLFINNFLHKKFRGSWKIPINYFFFSFNWWMTSLLIHFYRCTLYRLSWCLDFPLASFLSLWVEMRFYQFNSLHILMMKFIITMYW